MSDKQQKIYQLHHNKTAGILRVSPMAKMFYYDTYVDKGLANKPQDYILYYNQNYFFSLSRKALVQKAKEIKEEWIKESEMKLEIYKNIKI
jgi:hypothetical protein